jgi:hypothetical protein
MAVRIDVRRLAAVDMHGSAGARWRRWVILAEFVAGVVGIALIAALLLRSGAGVGTTVVAVWLLCVAANYLPLALHALSLIRPGALTAELAGVDVGAELRHYTGAQFWVLVPFVLAVLAIRQIRTGA